LAQNLKSDGAQRSEFQAQLMLIQLFHHQVHHSLLNALDKLVLVCMMQVEIYLQENSAQPVGTGKPQVSTALTNGQEQV
jgi:hypothetical protein